MSNDQKRALRKIVVGLGVVLLLAGPLTEVYSANTGLILALAVWIIGLPALSLFGLGSEPEKPSKSAAAPAAKSAWPTAIIVVLVLLVVVLALALFSSAFDSGRTITESRRVAGFDRVELDGSGRLIIEQTGREALEVEAGENMIKRVDTRVVGKTLYLRPKWAWLFWMTDPQVEYRLTVDELERVNIDGSGDLIVKKLAADKFEVTLSGSGRGRLVLSVKELDARISGSGGFVFTGKAGKQRGEISGSGDYDAKGLRTNNTRFIISGSGRALVNAKETLDVEITGSGQVEYLGSPRIDQRISGSGDISRYR